MEIKIGIQNVSREVTVDTEESADDIIKQLQEALTSGAGVLELTEPNGRKVLVPAAGIAYVDFGLEHARRVGFGAV